MRENTLFRHDAHRLIQKSPSERMQMSYKRLTNGSQNNNSSSN